HDIWYHSDAFQRFRGAAWMPEPCRSCDEKANDLGGCRCQAYLLTGDANRTDPVCDKSPDHAVVREVVMHGRLAAHGQAPAHEAPLVFRANAASRRFSGLER